MAVRSSTTRSLSKSPDNSPGNGKNMQAKNLFHPRFPLSDIDIKQVDEIQEIQEASLQSDWLRMTENEFRMVAAGVGTFYASNGSTIRFSVEKEATDESVELYLNGSVFGAILHQRGILPIHGSSFLYNERGILLCGHSGAGKSSLTSAMCLHGEALFLTDDVTPIIFNNEKPEILPKSDRVKLWEDSLEQLSENREGLQRIRPQDNKFYLNIDKSATKPQPLHNVVIINVDEEIKNPFVEPMKGADAFSYLQKEIYRLFYLRAMPQKKEHYFTQIAKICNHCTIQRVLRPANISIQHMSAFLKQEVL